MARLQMRHWPERHAAKKLVRSWQSVKPSVTFVFVTDCCSCAALRKGITETHLDKQFSTVYGIWSLMTVSVASRSITLNQTLSELTSIWSSGELWWWYGSCSLWQIQLVIWFPWTSLWDFMDSLHLGRNGQLGRASRVTAAGTAREGTTGDRTRPLFCCCKGLQLVCTLYPVCHFLSSVVLSHLMSLC